MFLLKKRYIKIPYLLVCVSFIMLVSSCHTYRYVGLMQEDNIHLPIYDEYEYEDYTIKINDEIVFRLITRDETISELINQGTSGAAGSQNMISYRVFPDGTIDIPFVKNIPVAGLTMSEARIAMEASLREIIPDVEVRLTLANKTFTVIGEAGTGVFPIYKDKMTLFQALAMSGEINNSGDFSKVKILRETDTGIEIMEFDIRPISIINSEYYYVYPNDIIYIQRNPASFYSLVSYSSFMSLITTSLNLLFMVYYIF